MLLKLNDIKRTSKRTLYECKCSYCDKIVYRTNDSIKNSRTCGCRLYNDYENLTFNEITYTGEFIKDQKRGRKYKGICSCGNETWSYSKNIQSKKWCRNCNDKNLKKIVKATYGKYLPEAFVKVFKTNAKKRNISFDLTIEDIENQYEKQNGKCYFSGQELILPKTAAQCWDNKTTYNISIDRINSSNGYTKDNIQLVTKKINQMKQDLSNEEFIQYCHTISKNFTT